MRNCFRSVPYSMMRLAVAIIVLSIPVEAMATCQVKIEAHNRLRRVPGEVNVECSGIHYGKWWQNKYQKGFGNWAVNSNYGEERDGYQFAGWYLEGGLRQWQSCTKKLPKPDCEAYNDNDCTGQKANPDGTNMYGDVSFLQNGVPCNTIGIQTVDAPDMHLVELDWPDGDDVVGSLTHSGSIDIPLTCSNSYLCRGDSAWLSASNGTVSADVQIRVRTYFYHGGSDR